jgi:chromatin remodeling complex protein RSC6
LSAELADFVGCDVLPRTEVVKRMWAYIKANDLQNPKDRREILCDEKLQNLLKRKKVTMFQINKVLSPVSILLVTYCRVTYFKGVLLHHDF